jgi:hypothetical protein
LGLRSSPETGSAIAPPPPPPNSPCPQTCPISVGHVVSGGVQDVYQHLRIQGSPARCKTLSDPPKESQSIPGLFSDNSTVVSYIRKQGGTHSPVLCRMTWEHFQFCSRENIVLVPRYMPGKHNILADALSRSNKLVSMECTLHMDVVQAVRDLWGSPMIDLFAMNLQ